MTDDQRPKLGGKEIGKLIWGMTTEDVGQAIIKTLAFDGLEFIDDSDENNLRVVTEDGVFTVRIIRSE